MIYAIADKRDWNTFEIRKRFAKLGLDSKHLVFDSLLPDNAIDNSVLLYKGLPPTVLMQHYKALQERIDVLNPSAILTCGNAAFHAVLGRFELNAYDSHSYVFKYKNKIPTLPTFHPNQLFWQNNTAEWLDFAVSKIVEISKGELEFDAEIQPQLAPTFSQVIDFLERCKSASEITLDIESSSAGNITCVGIQIEQKESCVIPFAKERLLDYWDNEKEELTIWKKLNEVLTNKNITKIMQNFMYDSMKLRQVGIDMCGPFYDTMIAANYIYPELEKGLKSLARLWCVCEPWKDVKDWNITGDAMLLWRYNALDLAKTAIIAAAQRRELNVCYYKYVNPLLPIFYDMCTRGMHVDHNELLRMKDKAKGILEPLKEQLADIATPLIAPAYPPKRKRNKSKDVKGPSPKTGKMIVVEKGYDETPVDFNPNSTYHKRQALVALGYKIPSHKGKPTTDRKSLLKLYKKQPCDFLEAILNYSKVEKLRNTYLELELDTDGRCRFVYNKATQDELEGGGTKSGRFTCSKTFWETGINIQTIPKRDKKFDLAARNLFTSELGILCQVDLRSAELYAVAWLAKDKTLNELLESGADMHKYTATEVSKHSGISCPRDLGKQLNYAGFYGCGPAKFTEICLMKADIVVSVPDAARLMDAMKFVFPGVEEWKKETAKEVLSTRTLSTPHGRVRQFFGPVAEERDREALTREALSFRPQAIVREVASGALIELSKDTDYKKDFFILMDGHDSILIDTKQDYLKTLISKIDLAYANQWFMIGDKKCTIPHDITVGQSWGSLTEYKR